MEPTIKKLLRTGVFLLALGVVTGFSISENGDWRLLVPYILGMLVLWGVDGFEISYGRFHFRFPVDNSVENSQTDKESRD